MGTTETKGRVTGRAPRAEAGDDVIEKAGVLMRLRGALLVLVRDAVQAKVAAGSTAARSQDFLYDDDGLPG